MDREERGGAALVLAPRGANQAGMREQNERLVLTLVHRHGQLAKSDIARMTGLSAQTVSVIMRRLEADRLLLRGEPQRGRVGQPSVPLSLHPEGAFFLGVKIGRRSLDLVLVDFLGTIRHQITETYAFPRPQATIERILAEVAACEALLGDGAARIAGLGVAMPFALWSWAEEIQAPARDLAAWQRVDIRSELAQRLPYPVYLENDATAACGAELAFGEHGHLRDFVYIYVGTFIGGGVVLNGRLYAGPTGNAGALGSMPVPAEGGAAEQLIDQASLVVLERALRAAGIRAEVLQNPAEDWTVLGVHLEAWLDIAARGLAHAIVAAASVLDVTAAIIDGAFPSRVHAALMARIGREIGRLDASGINLPELRPGSIGRMARALGGASLPLFDRYLVDRNTLPQRERPAE